MWSFLTQRLLGALGTLILVSLIVFSALLLVPGDPAQTIVGLDTSPSVLESVRRQLGLDRPPLERYTAWMLGALQGDLGESIRYRQPVIEQIAKRLTVSIPLIVFSLTLAALFALGLGSLAARYAGKPLDLVVSSFAVLGSAIPSFWLGLLLILLFAVQLRLFPSGGFPGWEDVGAALRALALPVLTLTMIRTALITRMVRSSLLDVLSQDYIRTARAKGLGERITLYKHALRNALIPIVTVIGLEFGALLTAAVVVEVVFGLPGIGTLVLTGIEARDYPLVQGVVLVLAAIIVATNFLVDVCYALLDPRLSYG